MKEIRLLLDTHAAIWWWTNDVRLSVRARAAIENPAAEVYVSAASVWEINIKASMNRLPAFGPYVTRIPSLMEQSHFRELPISATHAMETLRLRLPQGDPFDRLLVAQAEWEGMTLVTTDAHLKMVTRTLW